MVLALGRGHSWPSLLAVLDLHISVPKLYLKENNFVASVGRKLCRVIPERVLNWNLWTGTIKK
jgi:hypothetical protein